MLLTPAPPSVAKQRHSVSVLNEFVGICELRYALNRTVRRDENIFSLRGSQIHAALEYMALHDQCLLGAAALYGIGGSKCKTDWPLTPYELEVWLRRTLPAWQDLKMFDPPRVEEWHEVELPGCEWPFVAKIDLLANYYESPIVWDWKSVSDINKAPTDYELAHSVQGRAYALITGIRRVGFGYFTQYHDIEVCSVEYSEETIARFRTWAAMTCRAIEHRWQHGGWRIAETRCGLCSKQWCQHWEQCWGDA